MPATPQDQPTDRPMGQLLQEALANIQSLMRSEVRLAKTELTDDAKQAGIGGGLLVAGAIVGLYAFAFLLSSVVELLEEIMPEWLAGVIVSLALAAIAGVLTMAGRERLRDTDLVPRETMATLREDL